MQRQLLSVALAAFTLGAVPALAQSCDDPDPNLDVNVRITACETFLSQVYDRSTYTHMVYNLGRAYWLAGNFDMALPLLHEALRYNPRAELYWAVLGQVYLDLGEPGTAAAMYTEARALAPDNPYLTGEQAEPWLELGLPDRCLPLLDEALPALAGDRDEAWYVNLRGRCLAALGRHAEAVETYNAALALYPSYADAIGYRTVSQQALGLYEAVVTDSAALFSPDVPADAAAGWELAVRGYRIEALHFLGRRDEAIAEIAEVRGRYPGGDLASVNLQAWSLFLLGEVEEADRASKPIRDKVDQPEVAGYMYDTLAQIDLAQGRFDEAKINFSNAAWYAPAMASGWLPGLSRQGYLPLSRGTDDVLLTLFKCIDEKAAECSVAPVAVDPNAAKVPQPSRPDPGPAALPAAADPPAAPAGEGEPDFEAAPADTPAAPPAETGELPPPPALGSAPEPVRPATP